MGKCVFWCYFQFQVQYVYVHTNILLLCRIWRQNLIQIIYTSYSSSSVQIRCFSDFSIFWLSEILGASCGHVTSTFWKLMFYSSFVTHTALFPLVTPVAPERALSHHGPLHHLTQFTKRPAGRLEVFSPSSITQLLQARSLPPVPAVHLHPKISVRSAVAITVARFSCIAPKAKKGILEEHYFAKAGKELQWGNRTGATCQQFCRGGRERGWICPYRLS